MTPQEKMRKAVMQLAWRQPFYGSMLMSMELIESESVPTMCTDGRRIRWGTAFVDGLPVREVIGVLAHEVLHIVFKHHLRRGQRNPRKFNLAADFAINPILRDYSDSFCQQGTPDNALFCDLPADHLYDPAYEHMVAERIYDELPDPPEGDGDGDGDPGGMGGVEDMRNEDGDEMSPTEQRIAETDLDQRILSAATLAKQAGKLPGGLEGVLTELQENQVDFDSLLRRFVGGEQPDGYSYAKPAKKQWRQLRIIMPRVRKVGVGHIICGVDTSGSMNNRELEHGFGTINAVIEDFSPKSVTLIQCDARVQSVAQLDGPLTASMIKVRGRGGTRVQPVFDYIAQHQLPCDRLIYVSDMEVFDFPATPPGYPVLWVSTTSKTAPWGEYVRIKV